PLFLRSSTLPPPPMSTLFPYTTLFRSQHEAIHAIAKAVRKSRAGLKDPKRPMGSFIFAGPTGVGKTLLAKQLAKFMFGDENALRSEEHTSELQSLRHLVCRLLLEKKKQ